MSPIAYFGLRRCGKNARYLYALVFDLDGVGMPQLRDTLHQMNKDILPQATFVVNRGTAVSYTHLDVYKRQVNEGRPKGSGTAQVRVYEWRQQHPEGRKANCQRETGLDPKTIRKW